MTLQISKLFFLFSVLILTACSPDFYGDGTFKIDTNDWNPSQVKLVCSSTTSSKDCNGSVGILYFEKSEIIGDFFWGRCTAWLIEKDVVVANMHCLSKKPSKGFDNIKIKNSFFRGPEGTEAGAKPIKIVELLKGYIDPNNSFGVDYAYFKLESPINNAKTIKVSRQNSEINEILKVISVNEYDSDLGINFDAKYKFQLDTYKGCKVSDNSLLYLSVNFLQSPFIKLKNCPIIGGNSGSPMLDKNGEVKAIIWGVASASGEKTTGLIKEIKNSLLLNLFSLIDSDYIDLNRSFATKLYCIPYYGKKGVFINNSCKGSKFSYLHNNNSHISSKVTEILEREIYSNVSSISLELKTSDIKTISFDIYNSTFNSSESNGASRDKNEEVFLNNTDLSYKSAFLPAIIKLNNGTVLKGTIEYDVNSSLELIFLDFVPKKKNDLANSKK